jgi:CDP-glucose 4,6-dehydratase
MRAFMSKTPLAVRNPSAIRPWQHVLDPLMGYIQLCQKLVGNAASQFADGWNFGPQSDSECTVEHVLSLLIKEWGQKAEWKPVDTDRAALHEAHYLRLDCSKANSMLHWHPQNTLPEALQMTANWYKTYLDKGDLRALSLKQIDHIVQKIQTKTH